jgi:bifunctional ADP-heptose synthase (sugar kinase/adenylyltransferase)
MLTTARLEQVLERIPALAFGVLGDLFLDRYLDIDAALTERSVETDLDAYQVVAVRPYPGAAGTVINNLAALGAGRIHVISVIGDDGEGYELRRALQRLQVVDCREILGAEGRRTPTYAKPVLHQSGHPARELNRLDIKNQARLPLAAEQHVLDALAATWPVIDALLVQDQMDQRGFGVVTERVAEQLSALGTAEPTKLILADSRERIGMFRSVSLKPNQAECLRSCPVLPGEPNEVVPCAKRLAQRAGRPVFCTCGAEGTWVVDPRLGFERAVRVPAYPVTGPIDIVGAGDSTSAGIACALAAGLELEEAAAFGNLVASITIQQIGITGTASPAQLRARWQEVNNCT